MAVPENGQASLAAALVLLSVACVNIGYGLCLLVNDLGNAGVPLGVGASMSGLATIFITRAIKAGPAPGKTSAD